MKLTLREIQLYAEGHNQRYADAWKDELFLVWLQAKLHRIEAKAFPKTPYELYPQKPLTPLERAMRNRERMDRWREGSNKAEARKAKKAANAAKTFVPPWKRKKDKK